MAATPRDRFRSIADCPDCKKRTATAASGYRAAALRLCPHHRAAEDAAHAEAVEASPELRELYDLIGRRPHR